jgi:serine/threonine-protein kinase
VAEVTSGELVDGRYRILNRIGSGGMADVYCAEDAHLGRQVALKVLHHRFAQDEEFVERFRREASAAAGLQHPNVVGVFDRGEHEGTYYIAMEFLGGQTLKQLMAVEAPMDQQRAIDIAVQVLQAASFAHRRGVIHRDFKPHNVIVDDDGHATVTDFGIARAGASEITETGSIMGTAQYLSPEQAQGQAVTGASALDSIGVMTYEMLAGRLPFDGDSAVAIALKHLSEPPPPLATLRPDIHPALEAAVMHALIKDPAHRYQTAEEFIAALQSARAAIDSGDGVSEDTAVFGPLTAVLPYEQTQEEWAEPPPPRRRRGIGLGWALLILALLAAAAFGAYTLLAPEQVRVPQVVGKPLLQASLELERQGFEVRELRVTDRAPVDQVIAQDPDAGASADKGSTVRLTVSGGPGEARVPDVTGLGLRRAARELKDAGFVFTSDDEASEDVPKGRIVRQSPSGGEKADVGTRVRLIVSTGPGQVQVPNLVGLSRNSAESALDRVGLDVEVDEENNDAPEGEVIRQSPPQGSTVDKGSRVILTVSKGPGDVDVPNVVGSTRSEARSTLSRAGFGVQVRTRSTADEADDGVVLEQRPQPGSKRRKGATVVIFVGQFEPTISSPPPPVENPTP